MSKVMSSVQSDPNSDTELLLSCSDMWYVLFLAFKFHLFILLFFSCSPTFYVVIIIIIYFFLLVITSVGFLIAPLFSNEPKRLNNHMVEVLKLCLKMQVEIGEEKR